MIFSTGGVRVPYLLRRKGTNGQRKEQDGGKDLGWHSGFKALKGHPVKQGVQEESKAFAVRYLQEFDN
jgi:hypothetical protein